MSTTYSKERDAALVGQLRSCVASFDAARKSGTATPAAAKRFEVDFDRIDGQLKAERAKHQPVIAGQPDTTSSFYRAAGGPDGGDNYPRVNMQNGQLLDLDARALRPGETFASRTRQNAAVDHSNEFDFGDMIRARCLGPSTAREKRANSIGVDTAGGFLVPDFLAAETLDLLRPLNTLMRAGCGVIDLPGWNTSYARIIADSIASAHPELGTIPQGSPQFGRVNLTGHTITCLVAPVSEELIRSAPNAGEVIQRNIATAMSQEIDRTCLFGGDGDEVLGLANVPGTLTVPAGGANGGSVNGAFYDVILNARAALLGANAMEPKSVIYSVREDSTRAKLKDNQGRSLVAPQQIADLAYYPTTKVSVTQSYGTARNASSMLLGDFANCAIAFLVRIQIKILQERYQDQLAYGFISYAMLDLAVFQPAAFVQVKGIIP